MPIAISIPHSSNYLRFDYSMKYADISRAPLIYAPLDYLVVQPFLLRYYECGVAVMQLRWGTYCYNHFYYLLKNPSHFAVELNISHDQAHRISSPIVSGCTHCP